MTTTHERVSQYLKDDFTPPENSVLSEEEWDVYSLLSASYNAYLHLPRLFPGDQGEFAFLINQLKSILMSRPAEREMKAFYDSAPGEVDNVKAGSKTIDRENNPNGI